MWNVSHCRTWNVSYCCTRRHAERQTLLYVVSGGKTVTVVRGVRWNVCHSRIETVQNCLSHRISRCQHAVKRLQLSTSKHCSKQESRPCKGTNHKLRQLLLRPQNVFATLEERINLLLLVAKLPNITSR